jgi:hypothetical protein
MEEVEMEQVPVQAQRINPYAQHAELPPPPMPPLPGLLPIPVSKQMCNYFNALNEGAPKDIRRVPSLGKEMPAEIRTNYEKEVILQQMASARAKQLAKLTALNQLVPDDLKRFILSVRRTRP